MNLEKSIIGAKTSDWNSNSVLDDVQNDLAEILRAREAFSKEIREKYAKEFELLGEVYDLCKSLAVPVQYADTDPQKYFKDILQETVLRTANRIQSVSILLQIGNSSEAATVLRSIFEDLLTVKFISHIPILRSLVYTRYVLKQRIETLQRKSGPAKNVALINDYAWKVKGLEAEIKEVAPTFHFSDGRQWSGRTSHDLARETRLDKEFAFAYGDLSDRAYSQELPMLYPHDIDSGFVAEKAAFYSMEILHIYSSCIKTDMEVTKELKRIQRIHQIEPTHDATNGLLQGGLHSASKVVDTPKKGQSGRLKK